MRALLILALALPALAHADEMWRWRDAAGRMHYSNVPEKAPSGAARIDKGIGYVEGAVDEPDAKAIQDFLADFQRRRQERAIRQRLNAIEAFQDNVRKRQRERLLSYSNVELLSDWAVADRWMELQKEQAGLTVQLRDLEHQPPGS
jgi:hypothetical protein